MAFHVFNRTRTSDPGYLDFRHLILSGMSYKKTFSNMCSLFPRVEQSRY